MKISPVFLAVAAVFSCLCCTPEGTPETKSAEALARRLVPSAASRIEFRQLPQDTSDVFTLSSEGRKIIIGGNNAGSMAAGLGHYLKYWCKTTVSLYAFHPVELPEKLPPVDTEVRITARVPYRFFLNYCTFGYSMPWWKWDDWQRFIDWMAINGVNMPLAITGEEAVWEEVWKDFGLTEEEVRAHFTGPAHLPWHRMCNINRFGGPLPQKWIDAQKELQLKILERERELSMTPVLPSFGGSVPARFKELHPKSRITQVSRWGGFADSCRCWFLSPMDPLFAEVQKAFIARQTETFGSDHVYGLDLFNEVDAPSWEPDTLSAIGRGAWESLEAADTSARWLQMGWFLVNDREKWTPGRMEALLGAVPEDRLIMLDYHLDYTPGWKLTESFYGHPYIACTLLNFGGNTLFNGNIPTLGANLSEAFEKGGANLKGVGATNEGFGTNPYYYEYFLEKAWNTGLSDSEWIDALADRHIGRTDSLCRELWHTLINDVAPAYTGTGVAAVSHPNFGKNWNWTVRYPDIKGRTPIMDSLWRRMLSVGSDRAEYKYDLVNLGRQALGDYFAIVKDSLEAAYLRRDLSAVKAAASEMAEVMDDMERLMACSPEMDLSVWNSDARSWGDLPEEKDYYEKSARTILTVWGQTTGLTDYASRQWAGLIGSYYKVRWQMFCKAVEDAVASGTPLDQEAFDRDVRAFELSWIEPSETAIEYSLPGDPVAVSREIIEKYGF